MNSFAGHGISYLIDHKKHHAALLFCRDEHIGTSLFAFVKMPQKCWYPLVGFSCQHCVRCRIPDGATTTVYGVPATFRQHCMFTLKHLPAPIPLNLWKRFAKELTDLSIGIANYSIFTPCNDWHRKAFKICIQRHSRFRQEVMRARVAEAMADLLVINGARKMNPATTTYSLHCYSSFPPHAE